VLVKPFVYDKLVIIVQYYIAFSVCHVCQNCQDDEIYNKAGKSRQRTAMVCFFLSSVSSLDVVLPLCVSITTKKTFHFTASCMVEERSDSTQE